MRLFNLFFRRVSVVSFALIVAGSGNAVSGFPIKNSPSVSAKTFETDAMGLEFETASTGVKSVSKAPYVNSVFLILRYI